MIGLYSDNGLIFLQSVDLPTSKMNKMINALCSNLIIIPLADWPSVSVNLYSPETRAKFTINIFFRVCEFDQTYNSRIF